MAANDGIDNQSINVSKKLYNLRDQESLTTKNLKNSMLEKKDGFGDTSMNIPESLNLPDKDPLIIK